MINVIKNVETLQNSSFGCEAAIFTSKTLSVTKMIQKFLATEYLPAFQI